MDLRELSFPTSMRLLSLLLILLLAVAGAPATAAPPKVAAPTKVVLDNGLTIVVSENHAAEIVTLNTWVKVGSRDEPDDLNGAAHFVEHMLFKGTQRRKVGVIDREVEALGGIQNASTAWDYTQYYIVASSRFFDRILDIQADALVNSTFDSEELERERRVVIEELNRRDDTPTTRAFDLLHTVAYTRHPYRRPIGGTREVIQRMTRDQLFAFYRTHYVPENVTVVVTGDVATDAVLAKARQIYGSWRRTPAAKPPVESEPTLTGIRRGNFEQDIRVGYLRMGWVGPGIRDRDIYAVDVMLYVLGRGRAARLLRLRDRLRVVQDISTSFPTGIDPTLFQIAAVADPQDLARAEQAIVEEIVALRESGVTAEEVERAKTLLEGTDLIANHTSRGLAGYLGFYATIGDLDFALTYFTRVREVTAADVQRVARRYLDPQRYAIVTIGPRGR